VSARIDVAGILERAGANPNAPEGSQGHALWLVAQAHAELAAQASRYYSGGSRPDNANERRARDAAVAELVAASIDNVSDGCPCDGCERVRAALAAIQGALP
jgi:hypothetical protein